MSNYSGFSQTVKKLPAYVYTGTSCAYMFNRYQGTELDLTNFDTSNVTNMNYMFSSCNNLTSLDVSRFDTSKVTAMNNMFATCTSFTKLDLTNFDTSNVTNMSYFVNWCNNLVDLDMSSFDMSKVSNISSAFYACSKLENLKFGYNLGAGYKSNISANYSSYTIDISSCYLLTEASIISVLNGLYDIKTMGCNTQSCVLGATNLAKLTSEAGQQALAQAEAYGWTVS